MSIFAFVNNIFYFYFSLSKFLFSRLERSIHDKMLCLRIPYWSWRQMGRSFEQQLPQSLFQLLSKFFPLNTYFIIIRFIRYYVFYTLLNPLYKSLIKTNEISYWTKKSPQCIMYILNRLIEPHFLRRQEKVCKLNTYLPSGSYG